MEFSELESEWHPTLNLPLTFNSSLSGNERYWWLGKCNHEWEAGFRKRAVDNRGCPICSGKKVLAGFNDLATLNPKLASEWHPTLNGRQTADQITPGSNKKVWWLGTCGHEWEAMVNSRNSGRNCCFCSNKKVLVGFNDMVTTHPTLATEWHPVKNGDLLPEQISAGTARKVWWLGICGHEWEASIVKRKNGNTCPICSNGQILTGFNDLATTHPSIAAEWHSTKNETTIPSQVFAGSIKKFWWLGKCNHEWEAAPNTRKSAGCPICANMQVLAGFNDLATTHPSIAAEWHPTKNECLTPSQVTSGSIQKFWWLGECNHEWEAGLNHRTGRNQGCPFCNNSRILTGFNDLATLYPLIALEWHPTKNHPIVASQVMSGSDKIYWWKCDKNHEWKTSPDRRTGGGTGCPECWAVTYVSKAEQKIYDYISSLDTKVEVLQSDRKILKGRELDIVIPSKKVAVEFNGIYWHSEKAGRKSKDYHHDKWLAAQKAGIHLIQIWEDDWNNKQELVKQMLAQKLGVAEQLNVEETGVITVTKEQAEEFLNENHLQGFALGSHYLGLVDKGDIENLRAVMVLEEGPEGKGSLNIVRFAMSSTIINGFKKLLDYARGVYSPDSFTFTADHCMSDSVLHENNGFIAEKALPPDYMYVVKNERKPRSEYPLERFHSDPKLLWEEGLTEMELADLNGLDRIWDAGKTVYRLSL